MTAIEEYFTRIQNYVVDNPEWFGILIAAFGGLVFVGALKDWNWIFGDINPNTYDLKKLDGVINWFGRKTGRIYAGISGIVLVVAGFVWFGVYSIM